MIPADTATGLSFALAAGFVLPDGQYKGKPIGIVGVTEEGLLYLDSRTKRPVDLEELQALETYLSADQIRDDLQRLQNERD